MHKCYNVIRSLIDKNNDSVAKVGLFSATNCHETYLCGWIFRRRRFCHLRICCHRWCISIWKSATVDGAIDTSNNYCKHGTWWYLTPRGLKPFSATELLRNLLLRGNLDCLPPRNSCETYFCMGIWIVFRHRNVAKLTFAAELLGPSRINKQFERLPIKSDVL